MCSRTIYCTNIDKKVFFKTFLNLTEEKLVQFFLNYMFICCRLLKQKSSCSLNHFVERSVASCSMKRLLLLLIYAERSLYLYFLIVQVQRLRLLGDYHHSTRIAFVEFTLVMIYFLLMCVCWTADLYFITCLWVDILLCSLLTVKQFMFQLKCLWHFMIPIVWRFIIVKIV